MNMQDKNGNTALHRAVHVCDILVFFLLLINSQVVLHMKNNKGQTPLDLARLKTHLNGQIYPVSNTTCPPYGDSPDDSSRENRIQKMDRKALSKIYRNFSIGAVLIVTVTFAATFTMPGGYVSSDDDRVAIRGTPVLAGTYFFDAFVIANTLAFILSGLATFSLMYAGYTPLDFAFRETCALLALELLHRSVRCVGIAFVVGTYVMLASVAPRVVAAVFVVSAMGLLYISFEVWTLALMTLALLIRGEISAAVKVGLQSVGVALWSCWPFAVILILPAIMKGH
uniref:PGG domain-containing protein n=1 Tax=Leersia perrieri TaxID=77586 RepID=A0A0D9XCL6_9ORYZ